MKISKIYQRSDEIRNEIISKMNALSNEAFQYETLYDTIEDLVEAVEKDEIDREQFFYDVIAKFKKVKTKVDFMHENL